jgi:NADP-dependent 3-hydroxy acid dehydrogenase YdfG
MSITEGQVVLVVGASSGIGRAFALQVAEAGAAVAVTARRAPLLAQVQHEITSDGGRCLALPADALDADAARRVVEQTVERFGRIDLVLLNAGGAPALDMRAMDAPAVTAYMRSNYDVLVNYLFPVLDQMSAQGGGVVAHTNSLAGFLAVPLAGPYCAAKAALRLLIDTCRLEYGPRGIEFVSLYPGFVRTDATIGDGMTPTNEISEQAAVDHMLRAIAARKKDYLFPASTAWQVRVALLLPKRVLNTQLRKQVPPDPSTQETDR